MYNSRWFIGLSKNIPIYSGKDGCLEHWVSWNRGPYFEEESDVKMLQPPPGDQAIDITPQE